MILPIKSSMKDPSEFNSVLIIMMVVMISTLVIFGLVNYMAFGENTALAITLNYQGTYISQALLLLYLLAAMFGFPLCLTPVYLITESFMPGVREIWTSFIRIGYIILIMFLAILLNDKADKYISILGAVLCSSLAFVIPSLIHLRTKENATILDKIVVGLFVGLGIVNGIITTAISIVNW